MVRALSPSFPLYLTPSPLRRPPSRSVHDPHLQHSIRRPCSHYPRTQRHQRRDIRSTPLPPSRPAPWFSRIWWVYHQIRLQSRQRPKHQVPALIRHCQQGRRPRRRRLVPSRPSSLRPDRYLAQLQRSARWEVQRHGHAQSPPLHGPDSHTSILAARGQERLPLTYQRTHVRDSLQVALMRLLRRLGRATKDPHGRACPLQCVRRAIPASDRSVQPCRVEQGRVLSRRENERSHCTGMSNVCAPDDESCLLRVKRPGANVTVFTGGENVGGLRRRHLPGHAGQYFAWIGVRTLLGHKQVGRRVIEEHLSTAHEPRLGAGGQAGEERLLKAVEVKGVGGVRGSKECARASTRLLLASGDACA